MCNDFDVVSAAYERLVSKEDELIKKARTCEVIIEVVIQDFINHGQDYDFFTTETLLNNMQSVQEEIIVELSLTKIQKGLLAFLLKRAREDAIQSLEHALHDDEIDIEQYEEKIKKLMRDKQD